VVGKVSDSVAALPDAAVDMFSRLALTILKEPCKQEAAR
jgi:hypothetical protein